MCAFVPCMLETDQEPIPIEKLRHILSYDHTWREVAIRQMSSDELSETFNPHSVIEVMKRFGVDLREMRHYDNGFAEGHYILASPLEVVVLNHDPSRINSVVNGMDNRRVPHERELLEFLTTGDLSLLPGIPEQYDRRGMAHGLVAMHQAARVVYELNQRLDEQCREKHVIAPPYERHAVQFPFLRGLHRSSVAYMKIKRAKPFWNDTSWLIYDLRESDTKIPYVFEKGRLIPVKPIHPIREIYYHPGLYNSFYAGSFEIVSEIRWIPLHKRQVGGEGEGRVLPLPDVSLHLPPCPPDTLVVIGKYVRISDTVGGTPYVLVQPKRA